MLEETKKDTTQTLSSSWFSTLTLGAFDSKPLSPAENAEWQEKCKIHFPNHYEAVAKETNGDFKQAFNKLSRTCYGPLTAKKKEIVAIVKEKRVDDLKQLVLKKAFSLGDLFRLAVLDRSHYYPLCIIINQDAYRHPPLLDYLYQLAIAECTSSIASHEKCDAFQTTLLHWAIICHQSEATIASLIAQGYRINAETDLGYTPLYLAFGHYPTIVKTLIETYHADINIKNSRQTLTALQVAASFGNVELMQHLIQHKADPTVYNEHGTALHLAARCSHPEAVTFLLKSGVDVNAMSKGGITALAAVIKIQQPKGTLSQKRIAVVETLLQHKADPNIISKSSFAEYPPLVHAAKQNDLNLAALLLQAGAHKNAWSMWYHPAYTWTTDPRIRALLAPDFEHDKQRFQSTTTMLHSLTQATPKPEPKSTASSSVE